MSIRVNSAQALFDRADAIFAESDKFFAEMDKLFEEARQVHARIHVNEPNEHTVRFKSLTWAERLRYSCKFAGMFFGMLFLGVTHLKFKRRTEAK